MSHCDGAARLHYPRFYSTNPESERLPPLFFPPVGNLKPSHPLALDDDLAVPLAQFDLANVTPRLCGLKNHFDKLRS
jgi:hypothetical protein